MKCVKNQVPPLIKRIKRWTDPHMSLQIANRQLHRQSVLFPYFSCSMSLTENSITPAATIKSKRVFSFSPLNGCKINFICSASYPPLYAHFVSKCKVCAV